MKVMKIGLVVVVCVAIAGVVWYRTAAATAEGHDCCGMALAASSSKAEPAGEKAAAPPSAAKSESSAETDAAVIEKQKPAYPLDTCAVTGEKFGKMGEAVDYVYKGRLVRFCCKGCIATFEKEPAKYLAKLDEAAKAKAKAGSTKSKPSSEAAPKPHAEHSHH